MSGGGSEVGNISSQKEHQELINLKLDEELKRLEVENLKAPVRRQPTVWLAVISTIIAILTTLFQIFTTSLKREQLKLEEAQLRQENDRLTRDRDSLRKEADSLQQQREALQPVVEKLAKVLKAKDLPLEELHDSLNYGGTVSDILFPIAQTFENEPFTLPNMSGNKIHVSVDKSGKGKVILAAGGLGHPMASPPFRIQFLKLDAKTPIRELSIAAFPTVRSYHRNQPQFSVDQVSDFQLTPAEVQEVLFASQIRIKIEP